MLIKVAVFSFTTYKTAKPKLKKNHKSIINSSILNLLISDSNIILSQNVLKRHSFRLQL